MPTLNNRGRGDVGIHTVDDLESASEKADAVMQALNALGAEMSKLGRW